VDPETRRPHDRKGPRCTHDLTDEEWPSLVAPSMIPRKAGDRQKNDKRDAASLAVLQGWAADRGWVPDAAPEAIRDLILTRQAAIRAVRTAREQLSMLLLRHESIYPKGRQPWSEAHRR
jgi:transposase